MTFTRDVITQFDLPPGTAGECILCQIHQITFSNILAACMIQLDDKCLFQQ